MTYPKETLKEKKKLTTRTLIISFTIVAILIVAGVKLTSVSSEDTDNAQIDGNIMPIKLSVTGYVNKVYFKENDFKKAGDTLVSIDPTDYIAKVKQAEALLASAEYQVQVSENNATSAGQNAFTASINSEALLASWNAAKIKVHKLESEYKRIDKMYKSGAATLQQLESVQADYKSAEAMELVAAKQYNAGVNQSASVSTSSRSQTNQISVSQALVEQRKSELDLVKSQLAHTVVLAPFSGIYSKKSIDLGQYVLTGQPICSGVDVEHVWVTAIFKENQISDIKPGQKAKISVDAFKNAEFLGEVESIGGATGAKFALIPPDNATGNYVKVTQRIPVRIKLKSTENKAMTLLPGMSAVVEIVN